jgi:acetolactate synthase-1/2/3 large subunit
MKVYEAVAKAVIDENVDSVFTLLGSSNMEMMASIERHGGPNGPKMYHGRIEGTVVGMAEGYARSSGKVGFASVTSGPGVANTTDALVSAVRGRTPLVLLTGHPQDRHHNQHLHQEGFAALTGAGYVDVRSAGSTLETVKAAFYMARSEQRPVILDLSRSLQEEQFTWPYEYESSEADLVRPQRMHPDPQALEAALELIASAERPIVLAGEGAYHSDCRAAILDLAQYIGALLATSLNVKNWFYDQPFNLGLSGLYSSRYAGEVFAESDLVIGVGASLNHYTTESGYMFPSAQIVQIDTLHELVTGNGKPADVYVRGDAKVTVEALAAAARNRNLGGARFRTDAVRVQIADGAQNPDAKEFEIESGRADPRRILDVVDAEFPDDAGIVVAGGHGAGLAHIHLRKWRQPQLYTSAFGSIGVAFPMALGMAVAQKGRPVLHIEGDGSLMMNIHAFDTLAAYDLPVFSIVLNDSAFSSEVHQLIAKDFNPDIAYLRDVDFAAVARDLGCRSAVIRDEQDMKDAIGQFRDKPGPFVADVRASRHVISVATRRLHYGVEA